MYLNHFWKEYFKWKEFCRKVKGKMAKVKDQDFRLGLSWPRIWPEIWPQRLDTHSASMTVGDKNPTEDGT